MVTDFNYSRNEVIPIYRDVRYIPADVRRELIRAGITAQEAYEIFCKKPSCEGAMYSTTGASDCGCEDTVERRHTRVPVSTEHPAAHPSDSHSSPVHAPAAKPKTEHAPAVHAPTAKPKAEHAPAAHPPAAKPKANHAPAAEPEHSSHEPNGDRKVRIPGYTPEQSHAALEGIEGGHRQLPHSEKKVQPETADGNSVLNKLLGKAKILIEGTSDDNYLENSDKSRSFIKILGKEGNDTIKNTGNADDKITLQGRNVFNTGAGTTTEIHGAKKIEKFHLFGGCSKKDEVEPSNNVYTHTDSRTTNIHGGSGDNDTAILDTTVHTAANKVKKMTNIGQEVENVVLLVGKGQSWEHVKTNEVQLYKIKDKKGNVIKEIRSFSKKPNVTVLRSDSAEGKAIIQSKKGS